MRKKNNIVVAGGGVFGTAIAERLAWNTDNNVIIHSVEAEVVQTINGQHRNVKYFPTRFLNINLKATEDYSVFADADAIFLVIPSKAIVSFSNEIKKYTADRQPLVINLAKGMSEEGAFITENIPFSRTASMKGPSFAIEVLNGLPTAFTFGGKKEDYLYVKNEVFRNTSLLLDHTDDVRGVELTSILKNMYAIAIGLVSGRYSSPNVDFLVYTRAVNETPTPNPYRAGLHRTGRTEPTALPLSRGKCRASGRQKVCRGSSPFPRSACGSSARTSLTSRCLRTGLSCALRVSGRNVQARSLRS